MTLDSYFYAKINSGEELLDMKYKERWEKGEGKEREYCENVTIIFLAQL